MCWSKSKAIDFYKFSKTNASFCHLYVYSIGLRTSQYLKWNNWKIECFWISNIWCIKPLFEKLHRSIKYPKIHESVNININRNTKISRHFSWSALVLSTSKLSLYKWCFKLSLAVSFSLFDKNCTIVYCTSNWRSLVQILNYWHTDILTEFHSQWTKDTLWVSPLLLSLCMFLREPSA